jgi:two-component system NtrC family sensor kinase
MTANGQRGKSMNQNESTLSPYYRSLSRNMVLLVMVASFTPMVLVAAIILSQFSASYHEKVYAHLEELVLKHQQNIDSFLDEKVRNIRFLADAIDFRLIGQTGAISAHLSDLQGAYGTVFVDLGVVDDQGQQIAYAGPYKLDRAHYENADWFKQAIESPYYISDVFLGLRHSPHFIIAIRKVWQGRKWIIRATIDFLSFNRLVENVRIGETGFAYILNRKGEFQTHPTFDFKPALDIYNSYFASLKQMGKAVKIQERLDGTGIKSLYVSALLKGGDWLLVYKQASSDAFSDLHKAQVIALFLLLLGGLAIVAMDAWLSGRMVRRIATSDHEKEIMNQQVIETGKLASIGELAAGIAHEINNPVAIIVEEAGWLQDLMEDGAYKNEEEINEFERALNQIRVQGKRCKEITHKLLSFARKTDSRIEDFEIGPLIDEVVMLSAQRAKYSNVELITHLEPKLPAISASHSELQQVFLNLIVNACEAMTGGGAIDIRERATGEPSDRLSAEIRIRDNGPGIPPASVKKVFDPFYTTKEDGTGLGLSIVARIIREHGGSIDLTSIEGRGATFTIVLPIKGEYL